MPHRGSALSWRITWLKPSTSPAQEPAKSQTLLNLSSKRSIALLAPAKASDSELVLGSWLIFYDSPLGNEPTPVRSLLSASTSISRPYWNFPFSRSSAAHLRKYSGEALWSLS